MKLTEYEKNGVTDYYLTLTKYINNFINNNYTLTKEDMQALVNNTQTLNIQKRQETQRILKASMENILERKIKENKDYIEKIGQGTKIKPISPEDQKQEIFNYIQEMLEMLWIYKQTKNNSDNLEIQDLNKKNNCK